MLAISDPGDSSGWRFFRDLSCSDFEVDYIDTPQSLSAWIGEGLAKDTGAILIDKTVQGADLTAYADLLSGDPYLSDLTPGVFADQSDEASIAPLTALGVFRVHDIQASLPFIRSEIASALEDFRTLISLRRDLDMRSSAIGQIVSGTFRLKTREEAHCLATFLSLACEDRVSVALGLIELILNAVEHGNLELGRTQKGEFIAQGALAEEIDRRLKDDVLGARCVEVHYEKTADAVQFEVIDEGPGFDFEGLGVKGPESMDAKNGRGILMAHGCFDSVSYRGRGNHVVVEKKLVSSGK